MTGLALEIDAAHPAFAGHFPSRPVVPGVVLLDRSLRALAENLLIDDEAMAGLVCTIGAAKFLSPVGPGEALRLEVEATSASSTQVGNAIARYALRVFAGAETSERLAMTGSVSFAPRDTDRSEDAVPPPRPSRR